MFSVRQSGAHNETHAYEPSPSNDQTRPTLGETRLRGPPSLTFLEYPTPSDYASASKSKSSNPLVKRTKTESNCRIARACRARALRRTSAARQSHRVALPRGFGRQYHLPLLPEFSRRYPGVTLDLHLDDHFADSRGGPHRCRDPQRAARQNTLRTIPSRRRPMADTTYGYGHCVMWAKATAMTCLAFAESAPSAKAASRKR